MENLALLQKKIRDDIPCLSSSGGTKLSNLSNNISSLVNDKKVKEANIDLIERSKHVPLRLTLEERKLLRLCEAALGQTHDMFSQIVRIRTYEFFHQYFWVEKENKFLIGQKMPFCLSVLIKSKQILQILQLLVITLLFGRFVFEKLVKTCRELDIRCQRVHWQSRHSILEEQNWKNTWAN